MNKQWNWKLGLTLAVTCVSLYVCIAAIYPKLNLPFTDKVRLHLGLDLKGGTSFLLQMDLSNVDATGRGQVRNQAIEIIRKRVDRFGVAEPVIQPVGGDRILVQLPGLEEKLRQQARRTIERTAYLEFRLVHERNEELVAQVLTDPRFVQPVGYQKLTRKEKRNGREIEQTFYVKVKPDLTGKYVERAFVQYDEMGRPYVSMNFNSEGGTIFGRVTTANVGRQLAIVLDGELYSAPVIRESITGGRAQITGDFPLAEAQQLANVLENPLEAPVKIVEERGVDPSLGRDSIRAGVTASTIGAAGVVVFMLVYYYFCGLIAVGAMLLNVIILIAVLSMFGFTLTLPGIAGIALTIGMSVDANVLIYERIREELAAGKLLKAAIPAGFDRAFLAIFDSNLTTILSGAILIWLGSGPVQGFGITLVIGLLANMFAAVFVVRAVLDLLVSNGWLTQFRSMHWFPRTNINFLGGRKWMFLGAIAVVLAGVVSFAGRGGLHFGTGDVYGIDFSGGDSVTLKFARRVDERALRQSLEAAGAKDSFIQYQRDVAGMETLALRLAEGETDKVVPHLQNAFPDAQFVKLGSESVGAVVGKELFEQGLEALGLALLVIMIYCGFRFGEFSYGFGALVSLALVVLMGIGIFCLSGRTFSMTMIAAILTIVGYAINDTIVIFDRIRENRRLGLSRQGYLELINRSINDTLSRTMLTGGSTIFATVCLLLWGGRVLNDFAFTFLIGVVIGTFASVFIASPVVLLFHRAEAVKR